MNCFSYAIVIVKKRARNWLLLRNSILPNNCLLQWKKNQKCCQRLQKNITSCFSSPRKTNKTFTLITISKTLNFILYPCLQKRTEIKSWWLLISILFALRLYCSLLQLSPMIANGGKCNPGLKQVGFLSRCDSIPTIDEKL